MKRKLHHSKLLTAVFFLVVLFLTTISNAQITRTSTGSTDWNSASTWTPSGVPGPLDPVIIRPGDIVTVNTTPANGVASITFNNTAATTSGIAVASGATLSVSGAVSLLNSATISTNASISGLGTLLCGSLNINVPAITSNSGTNYNTLTISISTLTVSGDITSNNDDSGGKSSEPVWNIVSPCNLSANSIIFTHTGTTSAGNTHSYFNVGSGVTVNLSAADPIVVIYDTNNIRSSMITITVDPNSNFNFCGASSPPTSINNSGTGDTNSPITVTYGTTTTGSSITLTSGAGTNNPTTPINVAMLNITYSTLGATGATFSGLPPGVTGTWAAGVVTISGTPTTVGVYNYTVTTVAAGSCNPTTATGTITTYVCPTFSLLSTTSSGVNVCLGSSSIVSLTANAANLPVGTYLVSYEIQGVAQTPAVMIVTTAGIGSFVDSGFTSVGVRTITITNIASGLCSSVINTNNIDTVNVVATLAAPTALAGSGATCTQITTNWQALTGATYYEIDVSTSNTFASFVTGYNALNVGLVTSYNATGLTTGVTYYYRVRAFNGLCISASSGTITYATAAVPAAPSGLTLIVSACDELTVGWNAVSGATSYEIQWSTSVSNFAVILGTATGLTSLIYTITGLTNGTPYKYRIRAVNGCSSSTYTTSGNVTPAGSPPNRPDSVATSGILCNQFTVTWPAKTGATSYKIEWSTAAANYAPILGTTIGITALTYTITGLTPGTAYVYRVYSENGCGLSGNTRAGSGTTLASAPSAPTGVATSAVLCTQFTMSWTASAGAISYTVECALNSGFSSGLVTVTGVLSSPYTFTGLNSGTIYYYRVRAVSCSSSANATGSPNFITTSSTTPTTPTISTSGALTFCETDSVTLGSSSGTTYQWYLNGSPISGETGQFLFVTTAGDYTVRITNTSGCQSASSLIATVTLQGLPTATAGGSQSICTNATATVGGATATNGNIAWTENGAGAITAGATTLTPTYTPATGDAGNTVTLTMTVTSNNSCAPQLETATYTVFVSGVPSAPTISTITQPTGCNSATGTVLLINLPAGGTLNPGNISYSGTSHTISGLSPGTYNYTVTSGSCTSLASADAVINSTVVLDNIWDGIDWSLNHPPTDGTEKIIFNADYTSTVNLSGCSCEINLGAIVISSTNVLTLTNEVAILGGSLTFNNNASLIQINNVTNTGPITYIRIANNIDGPDYVYWSSPVNNQNVSSIYTNTIIGQGPKFQWNTLTNNGNGALGNIGQGIWENAAGPMIAGKGYIIRASNYNMPATDITSNFIGVPNNGNIPITVYRGDYTGDNYPGANSAPITKFSDNQNLLGNPYPSSINGLQFLYDNSSVIAGNYSLWLHGIDPTPFIGNPFYGSNAFNYSANDYLTLNIVGGNTVPSVDAHIIKAGQAFFVQMIDGPTGSDTVNFTNSLRRDTAGNPYSNNNFFRNSKIKRDTSTIETLERHRIWLDIAYANNVVGKRTLLGYVTGATTAVDHFYDAYSAPKGNMDIYSLIGNETYTIQGRPLPFDVNDEVPIGFKVASSGIYHIAINTVDGLFENANQGIYLEDTTLGIIHDLRAAPYSFTAVPGIFNSRFIIRYTNETLENNTSNESQTYAFIIKNHIQVQSNDAIKEIRIYDITGKLVKTYQPNELRNQFETDFFVATGVYIAKIKLDSGKIVAKKLIN